MNDEKLIALEDIRTDVARAARTAVSIETVERYQEAIEGGADFPLMVVFNDGTDIAKIQDWLAALQRAAEERLK